MKGTRGRKHKADCDCLACRAKNDPLTAYMLRHKDFFRNAIAEDGDVPQVEEEALQRTAILLASTAELNLLMGGVWAVMGDDVSLPGYLIMGHVTADDEMVEAPDTQFLDLWDAHLGDDAGVTHLQEHLGRANQARLARNQPAFNAALWITGIFSDIPLHGMVLADGQAGGLLLSGRVVKPLALRHMPKALDILREDVKALRVRPDVGSVPRDQDLLQVLQGAGIITMQLGAKLTALIARHAEAIAEFEGAMAEQRSRITNQADERRKAAVAVKTQQLKTTQGKVLELKRQLGDAQRKIRVLERTPPAPGQAPRPEEPELTVEESTPPDVQQDEPDEADAHWQETAEHQAVVLRELRLVLRHLQASGGEEGEEAPEEPPPARKLSELADWAADNADRVIVLKRAMQAARKSIYEDEELVFRALDMLATTYRDVKLGVVDRMDYAKACEALGLEMGGSLDVGASDAYYFSWKGRKVFLDQHLGRGIARDPRYCFRCYFTWDAAEAKVIVGWLPSHLPTRVT